MAHFLLRYVTSADYLTRREEFRAEHLRYGWEWADAGKLVLGGAINDPPADAVLLFDVEDATEVEQFATGDCYVTNGLVESWDVVRWHTVLGPTASKPIHP